MKEVGQPLFEPNGLYWKVFLIKNYKENESVVLFKYNHMLSDGVGALLMACSLQGKPNPKQLPAIRKLTWKDKMIYYAYLLTMPYFIPREAIKANLVANDTVRAFDGVTNDYHFSTLPSYKVEELKKVCKKLNCSINDFLMSVFTTSL